MTTAELRSIAQQVRAKARQDRVGLLASAVAFRIFLSIFPALLAVVAIFGLVTSPVELGRLLGRISGVLPADAYALLERTLERVTTSASGGIAVAGALGGLWAASSAAAALVTALNQAYDVQEHRHFLRLRGVATVITLALFATIASLLALLVVGKSLQDWLVRRVLAGSDLGYLVGAARIVASIVILVVLFALVYWLGPNRGPRPFRWLTPGSAFGVLAWLALSGGFALYAGSFGEYSQTYGSLAGAVLLMVWLQLSLSALLVGAELNQVWDRHVHHRPPAVTAHD